MIDLDATLDQQFLDIAVGEVEPQVPTHGDHDHLRGNRNPANVVFALNAVRKRGDDFTARVCLGHTEAQCNGPDHPALRPGDLKKKIQHTVVRFCR
ncbi:hypothetical protein Cme02nite_51220 [Catellatospora methionotrophica]|uniref:Uncharacterized protein n=1 Tax=Catellatospora methionotrophica TaxID=121620 RepID=A0A8J3LE49_9ACTN|nr:hypothetical protein Cme02nite_51220 [Catellatospora methionotrophica]